jgi:radical SAM superfamily enzyme YgiQ (UPF0313 family)
MSLSACRALLVSPRFTGPPQYMYKTVCDIVGAGYPTPPLGLLTVAALLPPSWDVRLIDRNFQKVVDKDLEWADVVLTGGMLTQQNDTLAIIALAKSKGKPVVVGGPDVTSSVDVYEHADFKVLGEAEGVIDAFLAAWKNGVRKGTFDASSRQVDITRSPVPRFDLINSHDYLQAAVQFSRGCPFTCEFCDVIELFGRNPRTKTPAQILEELDAIYKLGYRGGLFFVDDNLMGHRKALRELLPLLADWQAEHGYPFDLSTQITINLSDDAALMQMMREANFAGVFIGIESIDEETLILSRKKQNAYRGLIECLDRIRQAGMFVQAGLIVGFDSEKAAVAPATAKFVDSAAITWAAVSLMHALPHTQLTRRLEKEGRLYPGSHIQPSFDESTPFGVGMGLNFETKRPRRDIIADYVTLLEMLYVPSAYYSRLRREGRAVRRPKFKRRVALKVHCRELRVFVKFAWHMTFTFSHLRRHYWHTLFDTMRHNPSALRAVIVFASIYLDIEQSYSHVTAAMKKQLEAIDKDDWVPYPRYVDRDAALLAAAK